MTGVAAQAQPWRARRAAGLNAGRRAVVVARAARRAAVLRAVSDPPMRSFDRLVDERGRGAPLRGVRIVGIQHILGSTGGLLRALVDSGAEAIDMEDKSYSANWVVAQGLRRDGIHVPDRRAAGRVGAGGAESL